MPQKANLTLTLVHELHELTDEEFFSLTVPAFDLSVIRDRWTGVDLAAFLSGASSKAVCVMDTQTFWVVRKWKDGDGDYWIPRDERLPLMIMGMPLELVRYRKPVLGVKNYRS